MPSAKGRAVFKMAVDPDESVVCGICGNYVCQHSHKEAVYCLAEACTIPEVDRGA
jgi:hypothetical protein